MGDDEVKGSKQKPARPRRPRAKEAPSGLSAPLVWLEGKDSPTGRRVLDVRPATRTTTSASTDPTCAENVLAPSPDGRALRGSAAAEETSLPIAWTFDADALRRIRTGFTPSAMEDKWRIVSDEENGTLSVFFLRSWTNQLHYVLEVEGQTATNLRYAHGLPHPELTARAVLDAYLLERPCIVRAPRELGTDERRLVMYGISLAGRRCDYVESDSESLRAASPAGEGGLASLEQRRRGVLLGLAVGDALGAAVEFKRPGTFEPVTGYRAGGPHGLGPGEWTDDTSMALALADSLALMGSDQEDQARRYLAWWKQGAYSVNGRCFDIGNATRDALARIASGTEARLGGSDADATSGNGSIMRLAPVALEYLDLFPGTVVELGRRAAESSATTHRSDKCLSACRYLAVVLAALMSGRARDEVLAPDWPMLDELQQEAPLHPSILEVARGSYRRKAREKIRGSGYVVDSLEAALWAFHKASSFEEAVLAAVNLGDDADTTGAVCGQLAGAYFGADGIPKAWLEGLAKRDWVEDAVARLGMPEKRKRGSAPPAYDARTWKMPVALATEANAPPTERCYWVVPELLLAGAYPGSADAKVHAARLEALWSAGIRTFVNLMEPGERNPQGHRMKPYEPAVRSLAQGDTSTKCFLSHPIPDLGVPSAEEMQRILDRIDDTLKERRPVYVHCLGGVGRTGTVIGCWLMRHELADRSTVLDTLARLRRADVQRGARAAPETAAQRAVVLGWNKSQ